MDGDGIDIPAERLADSVADGCLDVARHLGDRHPERHPDEQLDVERRRDPDTQPSDTPAEAGQQRRYKVGIGEPDYSVRGCSGVMHEFGNGPRGDQGMSGEWAVAHGGGTASC